MSTFYHVKRYKELDDNSPTKNDRKDAWIIAALASEGRFFKCYLPQGVWAELRGYTQTRQQLRGKLNAAKNVLVAILDEYFPEYASVFKNLLGKASIYILTNRPFPADLIQISTVELARELKGASNGRVGLKRAEKLMVAATGSIGVPQGLTAARLHIKQCIAEINFYQEQITAAESAMTDTLKETGLDQYLLSIPGIGIVTAAAFLGEVGDITRFENWRQIRKLAGFNLTENSSGQKQYSKTTISKRGRPILRCLLYQASMVLVSKNPEFKALYQHLKKRRDNPLKGKQALIVIACKILRVMFTLAIEKRMYDAEKVLGTYRKQQLQMAA